MNWKRDKKFTINKKRFFLSDADHTLQYSQITQIKRNTTHNNPHYLQIN